MLENYIKSLEVMLNARKILVGWKETEIDDDGIESTGARMYLE